MSVLELSHVSYYYSKSHMVLNDLNESLRRERSM